MGRRARDYCEVASRTAPTYSDVELALVDVGKQEPGCQVMELGARAIHATMTLCLCVSGTDPASLTDYAKRPQRRHLPKRMDEYCFVACVNVCSACSCGCVHWQW